ncbi:homoserine O-acetyltransferase [Kytococcus sedentarius]|uniref:homoserine O-acetyltransferase family protein n=1 Tax=Kytococcus sedentarius TaxID=1276 RepID=UPI0035BC4444
MTAVLDRTARAGTVVTPPVSPAQTTCPAPRHDVLRLGRFTGEGGGVVPDLHVSVRRWGAAARADGSNVVLLLHALTGDSHVAGPGGPAHAPEGWWPTVLGPRAPVDTERFHVIAPDVLGGCSGTSGPADAPLGPGFPEVTVRDQVAAEVRALQALGVTRVAHVIGASAGGMRALEWAAQRAVPVDHAVVVAAPAVASADLRAWLELQRSAVSGDPAWCGGRYAGTTGPVSGLALARQLAVLTYRSAEGLEHRFGDDPEGLAGWLEHHGRAFVERFDAGSYLRLIGAMASHDLGRGRGGVARALAALPARVTAVAVSTDRFATPAEVRALAEGAGGRYAVIDSAHGHDGFLLEADQTAEVLRSVLA